ncbi:MAG: glycosyltransferase [Acidobacteriota bacterium]|nr:glycosyltransferase [Acidobacteriota bacterium]
MRIALVSPYSWTYPGGVTRHIEALAGELREMGHEPWIIAPFDPDDRLARRMHRGAAPQRRAMPARFVSLGRTIGIPANGAVSNLAIGPRAVAALRAELRDGGYDVVHIHEPVAPMLSWDALTHAEGLARVGTYHSFSENALTNGIGRALGARRRMGRLHVRIAVSESAAWTGRHYFGGEYRIVPNGVHIGTGALPSGGEGSAREVPGPASAAPTERTADGGGAPLRILFIGQAVKRKGLPVLLGAFEALREQVPATLTLVGAEPSEVAPLLLEDRGVRALGRVGETEKAAELAQADVLCAPSLSGESFGMVLTEAFAAGLPVVASDIHGYRDVARDGREGRLVSPGDPLALAEALREMALDGDLRARMARAARARADRFAWRQVAREVERCYEDALSLASAQARAPGSLPRYGFARAPYAPAFGARATREVPAEVGPERRGRGDDADGERLAGVPAQLAAGAAAHGRRSRWLPRLRRRVVLAASSLGVLGLAAAGLADIGVGHVETSLAASRPSLLLAGFGAMCGALILRALAWHAILRATPTWRRASVADALQGTSIGVLMSATLPARLGEPARALVVARRIGRACETLPLVLGTMVSQMLMNLGVVTMLGVAGGFRVLGPQGPDTALLVMAAVPVLGVLVLALAPIVVPGVRVRQTLRSGDLAAEARAAARHVRSGLRLLLRPSCAARATALQLTAWGAQLVSCWLLLAALGLAGRVDVAGAAAVLFAVNVTSLLPATPANAGVFQASVTAVLVGGFHVPAAEALAYGIVLQAVELLTAFAMGMPALAREGLSLRELRRWTLNAAPVELGPLPDASSSQPVHAGASA